MWNSGAEPATVVWRTRPALRTEQWFRAIDALNREGGAPSPVAMAPLLEEYRGTSAGSRSRPTRCSGRLLKLLGAVGRLRR